MTWKQALLKSIEKWDEICFEGYANKPCTLCEIVIDDRSANCELCPLGMIGQDCDGFLGNDNAHWKQTSDFTAQKLGCDGDMQMYFLLCMLYHEYYGDE